MSATRHTGDRTILRRGFVISMDEALGDVPDTCTTNRPRTGSGTSGSSGNRISATDDVISSGTSAVHSWNACSTSAADSPG
jgi:hypothetical protein